MENKLGKPLMRLVDANLNRVIEGLRVCEEIMRFIISDKSLTGEFKVLRHKVTALIDTWGLDKNLLLSSRNSQTDIGRRSIKSELVRKDRKGIFFANIQRAKESLRVLEEFSKLNNTRTSGGFKNIRYKLYQLEQEANSRL